MTSVIKFHSYNDVLEFVQSRRNGYQARLNAHDRAVAAGSGMRVGKLSRHELTLAQGELQALDHLLSDLMSVEFEQ